MNPTLLAIRALAVEFIMRLYIPVAIIFSVGIACLLTLSVWLTTMSGWWWILVTVLSGIAILIAFIFVGMWLVIRAVAPARSKEQKRRAKDLVDRMQRLTEVAATPKIFLWFQIARDIISPKGDGFIASIGGDTTSLQPDFVALKNSFKKP